MTTVKRIKFEKYLIVAYLYDKELKKRLRITFKADRDSDEYDQNNFSILMNYHKNQGIKEPIQVLVPRSLALYFNL